MITALYHKQSLPFLNGILSGRNVHPLEHYLQVGGYTMVKISILAGLLIFFCLLPVNWKLSCFIIFLLLSLLEMGIRIRDWRERIQYPKIDIPENIGWEYDSPLGWKMEENAEFTLVSYVNHFWANIRVNSKGLRDEEYAYEKPQGAERILLLGDSMIVGMEVSKENVIDAQLERKLAQHGNYQVINAGVRGYATDQSYLFLKEEGIRYHPDIIVYAFVENDPLGNVTVHRPNRRFGKPHFILDDADELLLEGMPAPQRFKKVNLWEMSDPRIENLYNDALMRYLNYRKKPTLIDSIMGDFLRLKIFEWILMRLGYFKYTDLEIYHKEFPENIPVWVTDYEWEITGAILQKMSELANAIGAKFLVFEVPSVSDEERDESRLQTICKKWKIPYFNMNQKFKSYRNIFRPLRFIYDAHWTKWGHQFAANELYQELRRRGWV
ncbi:MAG: hypothetical protein JW893_01155 [Candidatus Omnitrophica bacterium]|nr:hypothetical protein [Candidatus Omnitrophota bacterium]